MNHIHLCVGLRFKLCKKIYVISKILSNGNIQAIEQTFNETIIFTKKELIKQLDLGMLSFEIYNRNSKNSISEVNFKFDINDIELDKHKDEAIFKFNVIKPFILKDSIYRTRNDITKRVEEVNSLENNKPLAQEQFDSSFFCKVSVASIYRWINQYEDSNRDIRSLIPGYKNCGGKNKLRTSSVIIDFLQEEIDNYYLDSERPTKHDLFDKIKERVVDYNEFSDKKIKAPSYTSITRYTKNIPEYDLIAYRIGKRTADNRYGQINGGVEVSYPLERVEIDGTPLDLIVTDEEGETIGRPTFILALDKLSRYPLGFSLSFGNESWQDVMLCIWHILKDKPYVNEKYPDIKNEWTAFGIPQTIVIDNGLGFKNRAMIDACYQLNIILQFCPPRVPQWKGSIERFLKSSNTGLIHKLPGTTRSNRSQLGDNENPNKTACISLTLLVKLLHKWIIDVYSQRLNRGAKGVPSQIWNEAIKDHPVAWPNSTEEFAVLLGKIEYRQIRNTGIELMNLNYNSTELNKLCRKFSESNNGKNTNFKVKYDPYDINKIYVYDHIIDNKWLEVSSVYPKYTNGLSEWEHKLAQKRRLKKVGKIDIGGLIEAKHEIHQEISNAKNHAKRQKAKINKYNSLKIITDILYNRIEEVKTVTNNINKNIIRQSNNSISDIGSLYIDETTEMNEVSKIVANEEQREIIANTQTRKNEASKENQDELRAEDFEGFDVIDI